LNCLSFWGLLKPAWTIAQYRTWWYYHETLVYNGNEMGYLCDYRLPFGNDQRWPTVAVV
jgi:hypothetical protein